MEDTHNLFYHKAEPVWSVAAILGLVLGICSGPITILLVWLTGIAYGISMVGGGIAATVAIAVIVYCIFASINARIHHRRGGNLATTGIVISIGWAVGLIALFCYVDAHLN